MQDKIYYNQRKLAQMISEKIGCSASDIMEFLYGLGDMVKDIFSDGNYSEIKIFPGLKVTSMYIPGEQSRANGNYKISLSSSFTDDFKTQVRNLHNKNVDNG